MANSTDQKRSMLDAITAQAQADQAQQPDAGAPVDTSQLPVTSRVPMDSLDGAPSATPSVPDALKAAVASPVDAGTNDLENQASLSLPANVAARKADGTDDAQPKQSFLSKLGKFAGGLSGLTSPDSDPTAAKGAAVSNLLGRAGNAVAVAAGTPEQKQIAEEERKTEAELPLRMASMQMMNQYRQGQLGLGQDKIDAIKQYHDQQARMKGYKTDPNTGALTPMSIDERLADTSLQLNDDQKKALIMGKQAQSALAQAHSDALSNPNNPTFQQKERQITDTYKAAMARIAVADKMAELSNERLGVQENRAAIYGGKAGMQVWQPALDSGERLQVMRQNYQDGLHGDQQAMLSLLANHLGMTMGLQKGARINQAMIQEAQQSLPWLQGLRAKVDQDGYLSGVTLSPAQMKQMLDLGENRYKADVQKSRIQGAYIGAPEPDLPIDPENGQASAYPAAGPHGGRVQGRGGPPTNGAPSGPLTVDEAHQYLQKAGGDKDKARALAKADGRSF